MVEWTKRPVAPDGIQPTDEVMLVRPGANGKPPRLYRAPAGTVQVPIGVDATARATASAAQTAASSAAALAATKLNQTQVDARIAAVGLGSGGTAAVDSTARATAAAAQNAAAQAAAAAAASQAAADAAATQAAIKLTQSQVDARVASQIPQNRAAILQALASLTPAELLQLGITGTSSPVAATSFTLTLQGSTALTGVARVAVASPRPVGSTWSGQAAAVSLTGIAGAISPDSRTATGTGDLQFTVTPSAAGTGQVTVTVAGMTAQSVTISATAQPAPTPTPTPGPAPTPTLVMQGIPSTGWQAGVTRALSQATVTMSGLATAWLALHDGTAQVGSRQSFSDSASLSALTITPQTANTRSTLQAWTAATGGTMLDSDPLGTVAATVPSGTIALMDKIVTATNRTDAAITGRQFVRHADAAGFGEVPAGYKLELTRVSDGAVIPAAFYDLNFRDDGSLEKYEYAYTPTESLAAYPATGATQRYRVRAVPGTFADVATVPDSAFTARDIKVRFKPYDGSGDEYWIKLNDIMAGVSKGIPARNSNPRMRWEDTHSTAISREVKARAFFSTANTLATTHAWLSGVLYVTAIAAGGVTVDFVPRYTNTYGPLVGAGKGGTTAPKRIEGEYALFEGSTLVKSWGGLQDTRARVVTITSGKVKLPLWHAFGCSTPPSYRYPKAGNGKVGVRFASSGTLPAGLNPNLTHHLGFEDYENLSDGVDAYITKNDRTSPGYAAGRFWAPSTAYGGPETYGGAFTLVGAGGQVYRVVTGGTSAATGTGPSGFGSSITDGSVVWECLTPDTSGGSGAITMYPTVVLTNLTTAMCTDDDANPIRLGPVGTILMAGHDTAHLVSKSWLVQPYTPGSGAIDDNRPDEIYSINSFAYNTTINDFGNDPGTNTIGWASNNAAWALQRPLDRRGHKGMLLEAMSFAGYATQYEDERSGAEIQPVIGPDRTGDTHWPGLAASNPTFSPVTGSPSGAPAWRADLRDSSVDLFNFKYQFTSDGSHFPTPGFPAYLMTGRTMFKDQSYAHAIALIACSDLGRQPRVLGGKTYTTTMLDLERTDAWCLKGQTQADMLLADADPRKPLMRRQLQDQADYTLARIAQLPDDMQQLGIYGVAIEQGRPTSQFWMFYFNVLVYSMVIGRGTYPAWTQVAAFVFRLPLDLVDTYAGGTPYFTGPNIYNADGDGRAGLKYRRAAGPGQYDGTDKPMVASVPELIAYNAPTLTTPYPETGIVEQQGNGTRARVTDDWPWFATDYPTVWLCGLATAAQAANALKARGQTVPPALARAPRLFAEVNARFLGYGPFQWTRVASSYYAGGFNSAYSTFAAQPTLAYAAPGATQVPEKVVVLTLGAATTTTQARSWLKPPGTVTGYVLRHRVAGTTPWTEVVLGPVLTDTLAGLTPPLALYEHQIAAVNAAAPGDGRGPWSDSVYKAATPPVASFTGMPAGPVFVGDPLTGVTITYAGFERAYVALFLGSTQQGLRFKVTSGSLAPVFQLNSAGTVTLRVYDASINGNLIATSASLVVQEIPLAIGPYTFTLLEARYDGNYRMKVQIKRDGVAVTPSNLPAVGWKPQMGFSLSTTTLPLPNKLDNYGATIPSFRDAGFDNNGWRVDLSRDWYVGETNWYPLVKTSDGFATIFNVAVGESADPTKYPPYTATPAPTPTPTPTPGPTPTPTPTPGPTPTPTPTPAPTTPALDGLGATPVALVGLSRFLTSYATNKLVRVRRSSDNAEADIGWGSNNRIDETALLAHCGSGDGFVVRAYDQSGNGNDFVQTNPAAQPRIVTGGVVQKVGGVPALSFQGNDVAHLEAALSVSGPVSVLAGASRSSVMAMRSEVNPVFVLGTATLQLANGFEPEEERNRARAVANNQSAPAAWLNGVKQGNTNPFDTATSANEAAAFGMTATLNDAADRMRLGLDFGDYFPLRGTLSCVALFKATLSDATMAAATTALKARMAP